MFANCCYWFFFYKGQSSLYLLLPVSENDTYLFLAALITAVVAQVRKKSQIASGYYAHCIDLVQTFYVIIKVYNQCTVDVFFIDWEKSRGKLLNSSNDTSPKPAPVSVWRSIFMANQWNSLQTHRRVNIEFLLFWTYFILTGLRVTFAATPQPVISDLDESDRSPILIFAIDSLIMLLLVVLQVCLYFFASEKFLT
jgi:meckelin